jgi:ATP-dependent Clp protease ATP-binding subunit ClpC
VIERFSPHCRQALAAAEREARSLKHCHIATEHLLLGLLRAEDSMAARALRLLGVTRAKARRRVVRLVDVGTARPQGSLSFTPRVREIVEDALTGSVWMQRLGESLVGPSFKPSAETPWGTPVSPEAPRLSQPRVQVRSEDLLLALIAHGEGAAVDVLANLGVDLEKAAVATQSVRFPKPEDHSHPAPFRGPEWPPAPPKQN